jgi:hypothetical protein
MGESTKLKSYSSVNARYRLEGTAAMIDTCALNLSMEPMVNYDIALIDDKTHEKVFSLSGTRACSSSTSSGPGTRGELRRPARNEGYDPADPACQDQPVHDYTEALGKLIKGLRMGVCRNHFFERNDVDVEHAVEQAIADLATQGATVQEFRKVFESVDVVVTPTTPITAWKIGDWHVDAGGQQESVLAASWRFTYPFNLTGLPAVSVPCGFDRRGLPVGLQIAARPYDEMTLLRVAHAYERTHDWTNRTPEL